MIIRENIEFKRGRSSKEALDLGFRGLPEIFDEIFRISEINLIEFENYGKLDKEVDYIALEMLTTGATVKTKKLQNYIKSSNLFKFFKNSSINTNNDVHSYLEYDVRPEYRSLFRKFIENFGSKRSNFSKTNDTLYPSEIIQESIEFKRGQDSKKGLDVGIKRKDNIQDFIERGLEKELAQFVPSIAVVRNEDRTKHWVNYNDKKWAQEKSIDIWPNFNDFRNNKDWQNKFKKMAKDWIEKNTNFTVEKFQKSRRFQKFWVLLNDDS